MNGEMLLKHAAGVVADRRRLYGEPADRLCCKNREA